MNLTKYLCRMISQEACALSKLALANDDNNCNYEPMKAVYARLHSFMNHYDEFTRTNDII